MNKYRRLNDIILDSRCSRCQGVGRVFSNSKTATRYKYNDFTTLNKTQPHTLFMCNLCLATGVNLRSLGSNKTPDSIIDNLLVEWDKSE